MTKYIQFQPEADIDLQIDGRGREHEGYVVLENISDEPVAFKFRSSNSEDMSVTPANGLLGAREKIRCSIGYRKKRSGRGGHEKLQILVAPLDETYHADKDVTSLFARTNTDSRQEHRFRVQYYPDQRRGEEDVILESEPHGEIPNEETVYYSVQPAVRTTRHRSVKPIVAPTIVRVGEGPEHHHHSGSAHSPSNLATTQKLLALERFLPPPPAHNRLSRPYRATPVEAAIAKVVDDEVLRDNHNSDKHHHPEVQDEVVLLNEVQDEVILVNDVHEVPQRRYVAAPTEETRVTTVGVIPRSGNRHRHEETPTEKEIAKGANEKVPHYNLKLIPEGSLSSVFDMPIGERMLIQVSKLGNILVGLSDQSYKLRRNQKITMAAFWVVLLLLFILFAFLVVLPIWRYRTGLCKPGFPRVTRYDSVGEAAVELSEVFIQDKDGMTLDELIYWRMM